MNRKMLSFKLVIDMIIILAMLLAVSFTAKIIFSILLFVTQILGFGMLMQKRNWGKAEWYILAISIATLAFITLYIISSALPVLLALCVLISIFLGIVAIPSRKQKSKIVVYDSKAKPAKADEIKKDLEEIKSELNGNHTFMAKKNGKKYHTPKCMVLAKADNKDLVSFASKQDAEAEGFRPCKICVQ